MGGVNRTLYPTYPDWSNYSLWLELGGRGFDSAWEYRTQAGIAQAIKASGVPRDAVFITTKIPGSLHGGCCGCPGAGPPGTCLAECHGVCFPSAGHYTAANATAYIEENLRILAEFGIEYIDLLLLHEPCDFLAPYAYNASGETSRVYGAMEAALLSEDPKFKGRIKAIGVSNFDSNMLSDLARTNRIVPAVNQCHMSIGEYDKKTHEYCKANNITYQGYSVLHGAVSLSDKTLTAIAAKYNVSTAQVVERWVTQLGVPIVTASNISDYDIEDMAIFDFSLTQDELDEIANLGPKCDANPQCSDTAGKCVSVGCKVCSDKPPAKSCGSCGCATCCPGCKLEVAGGLPYCSEEKEGGQTPMPAFLLRPFP